MISIEYYNPHWAPEFFYGFTKRREIFNSLYKNLRNKFIIVLTGQRRTGKTTIMKQLIDELIKKGVPRKDILYYSFDEAEGKVREVLTEYEKYLGEHLDRKKRYIFFDEIQKLRGWEVEIKFFYDNYRNLKFFLTGSASLFIRKGMLESLAGRTIDFLLPLLSFSEYLYFKNKEYMIKNPSMYREKLLMEFLSFLKRPYIEIIELPEDEIKLYVKSLVEKIIFVDIPSIFPVDEPSLLERIFRIICGKPGIMINYYEMAKELGYHRVTISNYLDYLEKGFLIKKIYNFSKNLLTSEKKKKKFYPYSPVFSMYVPGHVEDSRLIENLIITSLNIKYFWRDVFSHEVDAILTDGKVIPIEVKYREKISERDLKGIKYFIKKFNLKKGIVFTKRLEEKQGSIEFIPVWQYEKFI